MVFKQMTSAVSVLCLLCYAAEGRQIPRLKRQTPGFYCPVTHPGSGGFCPYNQVVGYNPALFANPDTHSFNFGVEHNDGTTYNLDGGLRFPVIDRDRGTFIPWELQGDLTSGLDNTAVDYGHALKGVNPHDLPFAEIYPCLFGLCGQQQQVVLPPVEETFVPQPPPATEPPTLPTELPETFPTIEPKVLEFTDPPPRPTRAPKPPRGTRPPVNPFGVGAQPTRQPKTDVTPDPAFVGILIGRGVDTQDTEGLDPDLLDFAGQ